MYKRQVQLTPAGQRKAEQYFGVESLADPENSTLYHHVIQALKANGIDVYKRQSCTSVQASSHFA